MKKFWLFILGLFTISLVWNFTQAKDYEYTNLDITANILIDGTIDVKEDFTANFFVNKHWIIRDIPLNYTVWWKSFHIDVSNINVQWKNFTTMINNWNTEIKIWDANRTLIWEQNYPISYSAYGLIRNFSWMGYAELYWNLVGYDFDTDIDKVKAEIILPRTYTWFTADDFLITTDWKSKTIDWFEWNIDWDLWDKIIITYDKWLRAYQGITLAVKFPNDYFQFDHERQSGLIGDNPYEIPIDQYNKNKESSMEEFEKNVNSAFMFMIAFISVLIIYFISKIFSKTLKEPIVVQYNPPEWISPTEMSLLYHKKVTPSCIASMIYKWACEKRISIKNEKERFLFFHSNKIKIKKWENAYTEELLSKLPIYEKECRNYLIKFWLKEKTLPNNQFSKDIINVNKKIKKYCEDKELINENTVLTTIIKIFSILLTPIRPFIPFFISVFFVFSFGTIILYIKLKINWSIVNPYWYINSDPLDDYGLIFIIMIMVSGFYTFKKINKLRNYENLSITNKWKSILPEIYWYKKFIESCEEPQLRKFIEEDPNYINKVLPYAVALWLETKLMKVVIPIYQEKWYNFDWYNWDLTKLTDTMNIISSSSREYHESSSWGSYSSDSWFSGWSSFSGWWSSFSSGWGGWWWGWRSW